MTVGLRVVQLVSRRQLRGAEVFAARLSERLSARGMEVRFVGLFPPGDPPLNAAGVPSEDLSTRSVRGVDPRLVAAVRSLLLRERPHLVQANGSSTLKYSVLAHYATGRRSVLVYRNISIASRWLRGPLHRRWNRWLLGEVDHVVAVSEASAADLIHAIGLPEEMITVLPRGIPVPRGVDRRAARTKLASALACDPDRPILVHIGSFTSEKNHAGLLRTLGLVHRSHPGAQLVLFGDGPLRPTIERAAQATKACRDVHFAGARADAADLAAGADLLLLFSSVEGMPGVVLEAGARNLPVVASDVGGVGEVIRPEETGILVAPGDEEAFAAAICRLLADEELLRRLGSGLSRRVRADFDLETVADRYEELYRRLLRPHGVSR